MGVGIQRDFDVFMTHQELNRLYVGPGPYKVAGEAVAEPVVRSLSLELDPGVPCGDLH